MESHLHLTVLIPGVLSAYRILNHIQYFRERTKLRELESNQQPELGNTLL